MQLPAQLIIFWFPEAFIIFKRIWKNSISAVEEELAVSLMLRLLFTPLFHDTSVVGRALSVIFRVVRIIWGVTAFLLIFLVIFSLALVWFSSPFLFILSLTSPDNPVFSGFGRFIQPWPVLLFGIALFINRLAKKPYKKLWQVTPKNLWEAAKLKPVSINFQKLLKTDEVKGLFEDLEIKPEQQIFLEDYQIPLSVNYLEKVYEIAKKVNARFITASHFWVAMLNFIPDLESKLLQFDLTYNDFEGALNYFEQKRNKWRKLYIWDDDFAVRHLQGINRGWLGAPTPALDSVSVDLTKFASRQTLDNFIGRKNAVSETITVLSQEKGRNVLIIGQAGSGKSTLVNFLAKQIILGDAPESLAIKRLVKLEIPKLLAGVSTEGDLASKVKNAFEEVRFIEDIIIFVDEIHELGIGDAKNFNLYSLILPYLESDDFQFIASTEPENYARILEKNSSLARLFHKIELPEATLEETEEILIDRAIDLARLRKIITTFRALGQISKEAERLIHDRVLPDSALNIYEECKALAKNNLITSQVVLEVLSKRTNVLIFEPDKSQKEFLLNLEQIIHKQLIDQEEAVKAVANNLRRSATELREKNRPIGSFLFVGPTGVGKTELSKILSEIYFKDKNAFVRFDMSEYQSTQAVDRLIGTYENPGELTEVVKNKPYCLLLLDEFEKAEPHILTLFLQILEDGRLTGGDGKTVNFTNTIIIATSNVGSVLIAESLAKGETPEALTQKVKDELLHILKPELINRFDGIVIFKPLSKEDLEKIVTIKLENLKSTLKEKGYLIEFSDQLKSELAKKGFDPSMGARPLRRLIQDTLESNLSKMILEEKLKKGEEFTVGLELLH